MKDKQREIKFRAWDIKNHKMVEYGKGDYRNWCVRTDGKFGYISKEGYLNIDSYACELMQYTGLKDKNGVGIYEGDLFKPKTLVKPYCLEVRYDCKTGCFEPFGNSEYSCCAELGEVIGNIYENPQLLEDKK